MAPGDGISLTVGFALRNRLVSGDANAMDELDPLDPFSEAELAQPDIPFPQQIPSSLPLPRVLGRS